MTDKMETLIRRAAADIAFQGPIEAGAYAGFAGLWAKREGDRLLAWLKARPDHLGFADPPLLHGGVIYALMEQAALLSFAWDMRAACRQAPAPRPAGVTLEFLRGGPAVDSFAVAEPVRMGRTMANYRATVWQADRAKPLALGTVHLQLAPAQDSGLQAAR